MTHRKSFLFVVLLFTIGLIPAIFCQDREVTSNQKIHEKIRYVPFSSLDALLSGKNAGFLIPKEIYEKMKEEKDSFLAKAPQSPLAFNPNDLTWGKAEYNGKIKNRTASFDSEFRFEVPNERWVSIPLPGGDLALSEVILDGKPIGVIQESFVGIQDNEAPRKKIISLQRQYVEKKGTDSKKSRKRNGVQNDFLVIVKEKGSHLLKVQFQVALPDDIEKAELTFKIPRVPINNFRIDLDKSGLIGEIDRSEGCTSEDFSASISRVTGILGPTDRFTLRWAPRNISSVLVAEEPKSSHLENPASASQQIKQNQAQQNQAQQNVQILTPPKPAEPPRILSESFSLVSFGEGFIRNHTLFRLNITRAPVGTLNFLLPSGSVLLDCRSDRLDSFSAEVSSETTHLQVRLNSKISGRIEIILVSETKMQDVSGVVEAPVISCLGAERSRGFLGIEARTSIEIQKKEIIGDSEKSETLITPIDVSEAPEEVKTLATRPILQAYRFQEPTQFKLLLEIIRHSDIPVITSTADSMNLVTVLAQDEMAYYCADFAVKNNGSQYLEINLASGSQIISVSRDGAPIKAVSPGGDKYLIPLNTQNGQNVSGGSFNLRLVFRTPSKRLGKIQTLSLLLPQVNLNISEVCWSVYGPEGYSILPLKSSMDPRRPLPRFIPIIIGNVVFEFVFSAFGFGILLFSLCIYYFVNYFGKKTSEKPAPEASPSWIRENALGLVFLAFILVFVVMAAFTSSGGSINRVFDTSRAKLSAPQPYVYHDSVPRSEVSDGKCLDEGMAQNEISLQADAPCAPAAAAMESNSTPVRKAREMEMKKEMSSFGGNSGNILAGKAKSAKMPAAPKDRGAFPVEMKLPIGGYPATVYKRILQPNETAKFLGIAFWSPIRTIIPFGFFVIGLITFGLLLVCAIYKRSWICSAIFFLTAIVSIILEERAPGIQEPIMSGIGFGIMLTMLYRILSYFIQKTSKKTGVTVVTVILLLFLPISDNVPSAFAQNSSSQSLNAQGLNSQNSVSQSANFSNTLGLATEPITDVFFLYKEMNDRVSTESGLVFLSNDQFNFLKDLGIPEPDPRRLIPPFSYGAVSGSIDGTIKGEQVELKGVFELELYGKGFKKIPFPALGSGLKSLLIDGKEASFVLNQDLLQSIHGQNFQTDQQGPSNSYSNSAVNLQNNFSQQAQVRHSGNQQLAAYDNSQSQNFSNDLMRDYSEIWTEKEGKIRIEALYTKDLFSKIDPNVKAEGFEIPIPAFSLIKLNLQINKENQKVDINSGIGIETISISNGTKVTATLQPGSNLKVEWRDAVEEVETVAPQPIFVNATQAAPVKPVIPQIPKVFADHEVSLTTGDGFIGISDSINLQIESEPVGEFVFKLPAAYEVIEVTCPDLSSWKVRPTSTGQELKIMLTTRKLQVLPVAIEMEIPTPEANGQYPISLPALKNIVPEGSIEREKGFLSLEGREGFEISVEAADQATRIDPEELPVSLKQKNSGFILHAFKYIKEPKFQIKITKHQDVAVSTAQIDGANARTLITDDGKVITRVDLTVRNNNNQFLLIQNMPSNLKIISAEVNCEPVKPGLGKSGEINVPLIRSPRQSKEFAPFCVSLNFETTLEALKRFGNLTLQLPNFSFDISQMRWEIHAPEKFYFIKRPGPFSADEIPQVNVPYGKVDSGAVANARQSNVMSQVMSTKASSSPLSTSSLSYSEGQSAGLFPVTLIIPETFNRMIFGRRLISSSSAAPSIQFYYARENLLYPVLLGLSMFIGFLFVRAFMKLFNRKYFSGFLIVFPFLLLIFALHLTQDVFGRYLTFLGRLLASSTEGIILGFLFLIAWLILSGESFGIELFQGKKDGETMTERAKEDQDKKDPEVTPPSQPQ
ncbi:MAG: hypothetical protein HQM08_21030 [Candidatus Riflebacteria bacterium]|nr:hypothetical protein [Candidatus Riflebacteria bacterium]